MSTRPTNRLRWTKALAAALVTAAAVSVLLWPRDEPPRTEELLAPGIALLESGRLPEARAAFEAVLASERLDDETEHEARYWKLVVRARREPFKAALELADSVTAGELSFDDVDRFLDHHRRQAEVARAYHRDGAARDAVDAAWSTATVCSRRFPSERERLAPLPEELTAEALDLGVLARFDNCW